MIAQHQQNNLTQITTKDINNDISRTLHNLKSVNPLTKTCLPTLDGSLFIRVAEISHFKSEDIYCRVITRSGEIHFITKPLKWVEHKLFKYGFYRIHKSYFINIANIRQYHKSDGGYLMMDSGKTVPISRSKKCQMQELLEGL
ncbi:MAG: LytTR family DNA-binding domain-containing protein [Saprospiraceae bacterium]|nr:LytTR family DNA-binding domain-containing protein [Saprospiraceae bacterium]